MLKLSDRYFKAVVIKVLQRSITKVVEKNERKKMSQQRKTLYINQNRILKNCSCNPQEDRKEMKDK